MFSRALFIAALVGVAIIVWVLYLYRKGRLKEDYTILWVLVSAAIVLLSSWTDLLIAVNAVLDTQKNAEVVLAAFIVFLLVISIYFSIRLSALAEQNKKLAQELALVKVNYVSDEKVKEQSS